MTYRKKIANIQYTAIKSTANKDHNFIVLSYITVNVLYINIILLLYHNCSISL